MIEPSTKQAEGRQLDPDREAFSDIHESSIVSRMCSCIICVFVRENRGGEEIAFSARSGPPWSPVSADPRRIQAAQRNVFRIVVAASRLSLWVVWSAMHAPMAYRWRAASIHAITCGTARIRGTADPHSARKLTYRLIIYLWTA